MFVADLLKTCLPLVADRLVYNHCDFGVLGDSSTITRNQGMTVFGFASAILVQVKDFLKFSVFLDKI